MRRVNVICWGATIAGWGIMASTPGRADWPNFRGPNHDGISTETGLKTRWKKPIPLLWEQTVGAAYSSFAAVGDRVFTCGTRDGQQVLFALDADTGRIIWATPIEAAYVNSYGDGTRATPTVSDGHVYIQGAHGRLLCVDARTGHDVWSRRFSHPPTWGYSGSVLIEGELAVTTPGKGEGALAAFDRRSGEPVWRCGDDPAGYATPYPFTMNGTRYIVGFTGRSAQIAEASSGRAVLRIPWSTSYAINAASPIYHDGYLFLTSGYDTGSGLMKLSVVKDQLEAKPIWKSKVLLNKFQSCILHDGHLFASDQRAFKCVDFATGKERWRINRTKNGTLILADEYLWFFTEEGELQIGKASPSGFDPITRAKLLDGLTWTVPVLHDGKLYVRNQDRVACYRLRP